MNEAVKLTQPPSRPAWGWPPKAFSTCRPASASFVRRFWPQATHQARNLQKGCMMLYDFYDFYVLDRNHSTGCGCKSCLAFFGVPNDSFCPERLAESEITDAFLRITTESSNNLILCSKTTEPQAVRSLKRWNLTMQGMSDLLHGLPASFQEVDSLGQKSWQFVPHFKHISQHVGSRRWTNRLEQASAGKSFQVFPIAVRSENQALLTRGEIVHIVTNGMSYFAGHRV